MAGDKNLFFYTQCMVKADLFVKKKRHTITAGDRWLAEVKKQSETAG